jgi:hypothetical protein
MCYCHLATVAVFGAQLPLTLSLQTHVSMFIGLCTRNFHQEELLSNYLRQKNTGDPEFVLPNGTLPRNGSSQSGKTNFEEYGSRAWLLGLNGPNTPSDGRKRMAPKAIPPDAEVPATTTNQETSTNSLSIRTRKNHA